jgi:hypothetical protein
MGINWTRFIALMLIAAIVTYGILHDREKGNPDDQ